MATLTKAVAPMLAEPDRQSGLCLLVVEDDDADTYLIFRALVGHPAIAKVVHAPDGVEALRMIDDGEVDPDLAFIDLQMPRKGGLELLTALAERADANFPMVVLTSSASPADAVKSRLRSAVRVVTKPETVGLMELALAAAINAACPDAELPPGLGGKIAAVRSARRFIGVDPAGFDQLG